MTLAKYMSILVPHWAHVHASSHSYLSGTFRTCQLCGFWHFSVVSATFASACKHVVSLGGGMCILFEMCKKTPFQKCMGLGGRGCDFSAQHNTWDSAHKHSTAPFIHFYSESLSLSALLFSGRAGTPLGQTSPCLWTGTYFFNFCQSCNLRAFTRTQPSLRGMAHRPSVVRSTFRCLINPTLRQGIASLYPDFSHT